MYFKVVNHSKRSANVLRLESGAEEAIVTVGRRIMPVRPSRDAGFVILVHDWKFLV